MIIIITITIVVNYYLLIIGTFNIFIKIRNVDHGPKELEE